MSERTVVSRSCEEIDVSSSDHVFPTAPRALYIGNLGNVEVELLEKRPDQGATETVVFSNVPTGSKLEVQAHRVVSAGTSATLIVAMY